MPNFPGLSFPLQIPLSYLRLGWAPLVSTRLTCQNRAPGAIYSPPAPWFHSLGSQQMRVPFESLSKTYQATSAVRSRICELKSNCTIVRVIITDMYDSRKL